VPKQIDKEVLRNILEKQLEEALSLQKIRSDNASPVELDQTRVGRLSRNDA